MVNNGYLGVLHEAKQAQKLALNRFKKSILNILFCGNRDSLYARFGIIYQGSRPTIFVKDVDLLKSVCIKDFDHFKDFFNEGLESIVDNNIFFMTGDKWKHSKVHQGLILSWSYTIQIS